VVESHMGEDFSEKVGIVGAVGGGTLFSGSIGVLSTLGGVAHSFVVMAEFEWIGKTGDDVLVLHSDIASSCWRIVGGINSDAVSAVPPSVTETIDGILRWSSWKSRITKMAPASVFKDVGQSEQIHDISVVSGRSHQTLRDL